MGQATPGVLWCVGGEATLWRALLEEPLPALCGMPLLSTGRLVPGADDDLVSVGTVTSSSDHAISAQGAVLVRCFGSQANDVSAYSKSRRR